MLGINFCHQHRCLVHNSKIEQHMIYNFCITGFVHNEFKSLSVPLSPCLYNLPNRRHDPVTSTEKL